MAFPTTRWTLLADATLDGDEAGRDALSRMCDGYRRPVVAFLLGRGYPKNDAEDLAHEFFLRWLRSRGWKRANRLRGRFRSFMLGSLNHLLAHEAAKKSAAKRGGGLTTVPFDEDIFDDDFPWDQEMPGEEVFDREWAVTLVCHAVAALRAEFVERGKTREFEVLRQFLPGSGSHPSIDDAAALIGINANAFKSALHRLRERFRELLRGEVARTVSAPHEVDEELAYLRSLLLKMPQGRIQDAENGKMKAI
jgi:DNA-directed RNA polymerase specialized sigma24 family protein